MKNAIPFSYFDHKNKPFYHSYFDLIRFLHCKFYSRFDKNEMQIQLANMMVISKFNKD